MHNWESICDAAATPPCAAIGNYADRSGDKVGAVGSFDDPWMMWYAQYALGRVAELGFAGQPNQLLSVGTIPIGMIGSSAPILVAQYQIPVEKAGGGWFASWPDLIANAMDPTWISGSQSGGGLPTYFANNLAPSGREMWGTPGLAMLVDQNAPGVASAWSWWEANVYSKVSALAFSRDLRWTIVPRTDNNTLPPQSTTMP